MVWALLSSQRENFERPWTRSTCFSPRSSFSEKAHHNLSQRLRYPRPGSSPSLPRQNGECTRHGSCPRNFACLNLFVSLCPLKFDSTKLFYITMSVLQPCTLTKSEVLLLGHEAPSLVDLGKACRTPGHSLHRPSNLNILSVCQEFESQENRKNIYYIVGNDFGNSCSY